MKNNQITIIFSLLIIFFIISSSICAYHPSINETIDDIKQHTTLYKPLNTAACINDSKDDVLFVNYSFENPYGETYEKTDEKPNVDIVQLSFERIENSTEAEIQLTVNEQGFIEDRNDLNFSDIYNFTWDGVVIEYYIFIETTYHQYDISYSNTSCTINGINSSAIVDDNILTIAFELEQINETFLSMGASTYELAFKSINEFYYYFDTVPDQLFFFASINGPSNGYVTKSMEFSGKYEDPLEMTKAPYTYRWNFSDGTLKQGKTVTHAYTQPGTYEILLSIEDAQGYTANATHQVTIESDDIPPNIEIIRPIPALYIRNCEIRTFSNSLPFIFGPFEIIANCTDHQSGIEKVEFYINNELQETDYTKPYSYKWVNINPLSFNHNYNIKIKCYDNAGLQSTDDIDVIRFLSGKIDITEQVVLYFKDFINGFSNADSFMPLITDLMPSKRQATSYPPYLFIKNTSSLLPKIQLNNEDYSFWIITWAFQLIEFGDYDPDFDWDELEILFPHPLRIAEVFDYQGDETIKVQGDVTFNLFIDHQGTSMTNKKDYISVSLYKMGETSFLPTLMNKKNVSIAFALNNKIHQQQIILENCDFELKPNDDLLISVEIIPHQKIIPKIINQTVDMETFVQKLDTAAYRLMNSKLPRLQSIGEMLNFTTIFINELNMTSNEMATIINSIRCPKLIYDSVKYPSSVVLPVKKIK